MGAFYVNYTIKGADRKSIIKALSGRTAFVSPERNGYTIVFDKESDSQNQKVIAKLAAQLSTSLHRTVLTVLNHDSDIFWYQLYENGTLTDQYNSTPDYWSPKSEPAPPDGGDAQRLCTAFKCSDVAEVERILRTSRKEYPDATNRHAHLFRVLGLPSLAVGFGFAPIAQGYLPDGLSVEDLAATN